VGITRESCEAIRSLGAPHVVQLPLSLGDEEMTALGKFPPPPAGPFRALCLGRLLHWKGFYLAIRAFALFARKSADAELWIVGGGPYQQNLEKVAAQTGMGSRVRFWGHLSHAAAMDKLSRSHVLMHPALHDNFPGVCLEAMAAGRPVICLNIGGPAIQVTPETGFIAPAKTPEESVQAMASFLTRLDEDRVLLAEMSARARIRVREEFTVNKIGAATSALYAEAVAIHAESCRQKVSRI
jgi:glycosyltransferase involved in cell wall biosynthesis